MPSFLPERITTMTFSFKKAVLAAAAVTTFAGVPAVHAQQSGIVKPASNDRKVELGSLTCTVQPNTRRNYIVRSTAQVDCEFKPLNGEAERYTGVTGIQLGIDLSVREKDVLRFGVVTTRKVGDDRPVDSLSGKYFGASATATVTYGFGASALVGVNGREVALVPAGVETIRGLGVSAGLGFLYIEPAPKS